MCFRTQGPHFWQLFGSKGSMKLTESSSWLIAVHWIIDLTAGTLSQGHASPRRVDAERATTILKFPSIMCQRPSLNRRLKLQSLTCSYHDSPLGKPSILFIFCTDGKVKTVDLTCLCSPRLNYLLTVFIKYKFLKIFISKDSEHFMQKSFWILFCYVY